jgi:FtsZ-binding cell division protein ZapB
MLTLLLLSQEAEDLKRLSELQKEKDGLKQQLTALINASPSTSSGSSDAALQTEIASLKSSNEVLNEEIKVLKASKRTLEQRNAEYKSEIEALKVTPFL